ncbi:ATP-binding cassette domain-containing protein [Gordonia sp. zg691]|uniref:ATP-binding cassette domain-containing protein n=1 Tax=Gordonia jinghuaiqii TaxID=2758710 RepID=UPI0016628408|nr:ATP-binding cassette domain-containing protein [Gordonia jinghuaiqii]MBD0863428.1 ATP-binding cassette domain-containing protein [Gordonia jinghuaiqii]
MVDHTTVIDADAIGVHAGWGHIYGPETFRVREGGVTVLSGRAGRGRTALLLTLAGRMKPTSGTLTAFGRTGQARHLFASAAIAYIDEVDRVAQTIRVSDVVSEEIRWKSRWYRWVRRSGRDDLEHICGPVFGEHPLPRMDAFVEELPELTATLLRIAVANVGRPPLLVVGGVDRLTSIGDSAAVLDRLVVLGHTQTVITADINAATTGQSALRDVIALDHLTDTRVIDTGAPDHQPPHHERPDHEPTGDRNGEPS